MLSAADKRFRNLDSGRAVSLFLAITARRRMTLGAHLEGQGPENRREGQSTPDKRTAEVHVYIVLQVPLHRHQ